MRVVFVKLKALVAAFAFIALLAVASFTAYAADASGVYWSGPRALPVYCVDREDNKIAITFDCAWGVEYTDALLDCLKDTSVRATFFMVQFWTEKYPEYVKKIDEAGCEIGTHSATHSYMSRQSETEIKQELESSSQAITNITGKKVDLFRPPYGDYDDLLINTSNSAGFLPIQWDVDSLDWKDLSASDIAARVCDRVKRRSNFIWHNNGLHPAEAVGGIIATRGGKGFEFVPVGELVYRENYTIDATGRQIPKNAS